VSLLAGATRLEPPSANAAETASIPASQADLNSPPLPYNAVVAHAPHAAQPPTYEPEPPGVEEYLEAAEEISLLGMNLRIEARQGIQGLLIVDIAPQGPAASAGLHPFQQRAKDLINGASMLAAMAFPPAVIIGPIVGAIPTGETYDLVIGVDGYRVSNFIDLYARMRGVRPGEIVYLNVLRNGRRAQVPVRVTAPLPPMQSWVR
jgi:S1-C subfamily serine protease